MTITGRDIGGRICKALNLSRVTASDIRMRMNEVVTLTVQQMMTQDQGNALCTVLSEYTLQSKHKQPSQNPWSIINEFDQWFEWETSRA